MSFVLFNLVFLELSIELDSITWIIRHQGNKVEGGNGPGYHVTAAALHCSSTEISSTFSGTRFRVFLALSPHSKTEKDNFSKCCDQLGTHPQRIVRNFPRLGRYDVTCCGNDGDVMNPLLIHFTALLNGSHKHWTAGMQRNPRSLRPIA